MSNLKWIVLVGFNNCINGQTVFIAYVLGHAFHSLLIFLIELTYQLCVLLGAGQLQKGSAVENVPHSAQNV